MSVAATETNTVLALFGARTSSVDKMPSFGNAYGPDRRPHDGKRYDVYHQFPRSETGQFPKFDIRGTAATGLSSMSYAALTSSMHLHVDWDETIPEWSSIISVKGRTVTNRSLDSKKLLMRASGEAEVLRISKCLLRDTLAPDWNSVPGPLSVREIVDQACDPAIYDLEKIDTSTFGENVRFNKQFSAVTIIVVQSLESTKRSTVLDSSIVPEEAFTSEDVLIELLDRSDDDFNQQMGIAIALRSRHRTGHLADSANEARKLRDELYLLTDFLAGHLFLLQSLQTIREKMLEHLDELVAIGSGYLHRLEIDASDTEFGNRTAVNTMIARDTAIHKIWKLRTDSLHELEHKWHLNDPSPSCQPLLRLIEDRLNLTEAWERERTEVHRIAEVADYLGDHKPRILAGHMPVYQPPDLPNWLGVDKQKSPKSRPGVSPGRLVELHPFRNRDMIMATVGSRITTSALLTATAGLLLGLLLSEPENLESPFDSLLLLVSTIAFFFETLVLSHGARMLQFTTRAVALRVERANGVALFLGQYPFAIALPLAMTRLIGNSDLTGEGRILSYVVSILALLALVIYFELIEAGSFKLMSLPAIRPDADGGAIHRFGRFGALGGRIIVGVLHLMAMLVLFGAMLGWPDWLLWSAVSSLLVLLTVMACVSWIVSGYEGYVYYEVDDWDCMGEEERSFVEGLKWRGPVT